MLISTQKVARNANKNICDHAREREVSSVAGQSNGTCILKNMWHLLFHCITKSPDQGRFQIVLSAICLEVCRSAYTLECQK
ncbi:hypothetical protein GJ496_002729 [Pomphorhynchus laevis]|nr:hypothetical protein GJ496_003045 [Pomphorhynchus laevis]KAI0985508.1 hypothetical protein GJ496_002729 [Pomphorhynchus laevis]